MNINRRYVLFVPFVILLIALADWTTRHTEMFSSSPTPQVKDEEHPAKTEMPTKTHPAKQFVPVYDVGTLVSSRPEQKVEKVEPIKDKAHPRPGKKPIPTKKETTVPVLLRNTQGPVLTIDYKSIGFDRYLEIAESIGRLFLVIRTDDGLRLGPAVTFRKGSKLLPNTKRMMKHLATQNPHMITDVKIKTRLQALPLPSKALDERLILLMTEPFNNVMWATLKKKLKQHHLEANEISAIRGFYEITTRGTFLYFKSATVRSNGRIITLNHRLRVRF